MDLTEGTIEEKNARAKKMMLWLGIISLIMSFAGWTSAIIVSSSRPDWLSDYDLPTAFYYSTALIIVSSVTMIMAKQALKRDNHKMTGIWLFLTLILGCIFIYNQLVGFDQIVQDGYNFTGPTSNITMSFIFLIAFVHILHVVVGLICLGVVIVNHYRRKYSSNNMLGLELASTFWHFIDLLWVYLFLFLYFFR